MIQCMQRKTTKRNDDSNQVNQEGVWAEVGEVVWRAQEVAAGVEEGVVLPVEEEEDATDEADPT